MIEKLSAGFENNVTVILADLGNFISVLMIQHKKQMDEQAGQSREQDGQHKAQMEEQAKQHREQMAK